MLLREHLVALYRGAHQKRFYALKHDSFEVNQGENLAVVGNKGAGKSTLLALVAGLHRRKRSTSTISRLLLCLR